MQTHPRAPVRRAHAARVALVALVATAACGSSTVIPGGDSSVDTAVSTPCPATVPGQGAACARSELECAYGADPRLECRTLARCTAGAWVVTAAASCAAPASSPGCPAQAPANNSACGSDAGFTFESCFYDDGARCFCSGAGSPLMFRCVFPEDPRCPARAVPNRGDGCASEGADCNYGLCGDGTRVRCTGGIWVNVPSPCTR